MFRVHGATMTDRSPPKENTMPKTEAKPRNEWTTDRPHSNGGTPYDAVGVRVTKLGDERMVSIYTDTPEFPASVDPCSFDTTVVHLTPERALELARAIQESVAMSNYVEKGSVS